jgi:small subunit ribosomal protein S1
MTPENDDNALPVSAEAVADQSNPDVSLSESNSSEAKDAAENSAPTEKSPAVENNGGAASSEQKDSNESQPSNAIAGPDGFPDATSEKPPTAADEDGKPAGSAAHESRSESVPDARAKRSRAKYAEQSSSQAGGESSEQAPEHGAEQAGEESSEHMDQLMAQYASPSRPAGEDETVEGKVVAITEAGVVVDIGGKLEGLIPAQEMMEIGVPLPFEPGQTIEVERLSEEKDGYKLLSYIRVHRRQLWDRIKKAFREHAPMTGKVVELIKGGLVVDIGVRAFLPASQIDIRPAHELDQWKDQEITVRVLKLNPKRGNVVVSRRVLLEEEQKAKRELLAADLKEGDVVRGKVKNIADYGVFVDLGGLDGLLHVSDLVWGRITHPSEAVKTGDELEVKILKFDRERMRISLGRKQLVPDPWATVPERFPVGSRIQGQVVGLTDYGAFVQVEPGIEGLVHVSEMSWSRRMQHPSKIVAEGDEVEVVVLDLKPEERRISLGLKQTLPDPWDAVSDRYTPGSVVTGRVRNVTDFGAFVEVEDGVEGLIHVGDISWTERVEHPNTKFKKGDNVEAKVLKVDAEHRRLSLGVKQLHDSVGEWLQHHSVGEVLRGKVSRLTTFGAFVELAEGVEGLCHISEIEERRSKADREKPQQRDANRMGPISVGQEYDFKVIKAEPSQRKISLSYRAAHRQAEQRDLDSFRSSSKSSSSATIGDAIMAKRRQS